MHSKTFSDAFRTLKTLLEEKVGSKRVTLSYGCMVVRNGKFTQLEVGLINGTM